MGGGGCEVWVARATERAKLVVGGKSAVESKKGGAHVKGFSWEPIEEESGSSQGVNPVGGWHGGLKEEGANDIVRGADHAFGFSVLL